MIGLASTDWDIRLLGGSGGMLPGQNLRFEVLALLEMYWNCQSCHHYIFLIHFESFTIPSDGAFLALGEVLPLPLPTSTGLDYSLKFEMGGGGRFFKFGLNWGIENWTFGSEVGSGSEGGGGVLPYSLCGGVPLGSRKSYPLLDQILQFSWPYTRLKCSIVLDLNLLWAVPLNETLY